jgi:hypothetical protein
MTPRIVPGFSSPTPDHACCRRASTVTGACSPETVDAGGSTFMGESFIIELQSQVAGIVVREGGAFRFYAATRAFNLLEGRLFNAPHHAQKAVESTRRRTGKIDKA